MRYTLFLSSIIAALGGFLFGFDTVVISGAEQTLEKIFQPIEGLSETAKAAWHGLLVASALIGTIIGALTVGKPADLIGRRSTMFWIALLYLASAIGSAFAWSWLSFVLFRFIGGLAVGGSSVVSPMYIAEISPAAFRGRLVALTQLNIVLGVLIALCSNYMISQYLPVPEYSQWRWMMGVEAFPAAVYFLLLFKTPRSPRWLMAVGRETEARDVLELVGIDSECETIDAAIGEIKHSLMASMESLQEAFFQRKNAFPIFLAFSIAAFNQLSGINAVWYFSNRIFQNVGYDTDASLLASVGLGAINLIATAIALLVIDRVGRRKLMLVGSLGYIVSLSLTAWLFGSQSNPESLSSGEAANASAWLVMVSLLVFVASHALGQGVVIWVFISEIFPTSIRARGQAFGSFVHWTFAAAISYAFPLFAEHSASHIFGFFALCMFVQLLWVIFIMPETKGITLEKMEENLMQT